MATIRPGVQSGLRAMVALLQFEEPSSIYGAAGSPAGRGCSSGVEHNLAKVGVEGSNPFARSKFLKEIPGVEKRPLSAALPLFLFGVHLRSTERGDHRTSTPAARLHDGQSIAARTLTKDATLNELREAARDLRALSPASALADLVEAKIESTLAALAP